MCPVIPWQKVYNGASLCLARDARLDPFDKLVLRNGHALSDLQGREAFAVHELVGIGTGDAEHLCHILCGKSQRELFNVLYFVSMVCFG